VRTRVGLSATKELAIAGSITMLFAAGILHLEMHLGHLTQQAESPGP